MEDLTLVNQLRATLGRLEAGLAAVEEGLVFTNLDGIIEWTNAAFDRFVGRSRLQCLGVDLTTLLPERYQDGQAQPADCLLFWAKTGAGRATWDLSPAPPRRVVEVVWATVDIPSKPSFVFTFRDQSAIVQAQDALIDARNHLEIQVDERTRELQLARDAALTASQTKTRFLASMSHEIRTPMNAVIGMTELLLESQLNSDQMEMVTTIQGSGEHLLGVINDILDISQIESGRITLNSRAFDMLALLNDCRVLFQHQANAKGLTMEMDLPPDMPQWILGDDLKTRQILVNLLGNACKYTHHGNVRLSLGFTGSETGSCRFQFHVTDTGIGIPDDVLPFIFEEFSRRSNRSLSTQSAGLGLSICRRLCDLMGGEISVQSCIGQGTRFTVQLPFEITQKPHQEPEAPAWNSSSDANATERIRILVADDSRVNQRVLELMLGRFNLDAELVGDGEAALARIAAGGIDLVFMDVEMPKLDGLAATRQLRASGFEDVYIIALTAYSYSSHRLDCEAAGMNDFLAKPLRHQDLCDALTRFREFQSQPDQYSPG